MASVPPQAKLVVAAIIRDRRNHVLLARRATADHGAGGWEFPGGKVEPGEAPRACLAREIQEELGLTVTVGPRVSDSVYAYANGAIRLLAFEAEIIAGQPTPHEHEEIAWVPLEELPRYDVLPADREIVRVLCEHTAPPDPVHLYCHIPFCERRCAYCDFPRLAGHVELHAPYVAALTHEITSVAASYGDTRPSVPTVYVGGGTPSCLDPGMLTSVLNAIHSSFDVDPNAEITVECNPNSLDGAWVRAMQAAGVNRFSLGVQSLHDAELRTLGRLHNAAGARAAFDLLRAEGCANLSVDLIVGFPSQSTESWRSTVQAVAREWHPEHVSLYMFSLEHGTRLARLKEDQPRTLAWPDDEQTMDWYWLAADLLGAAGYKCYEISNYALPGYESRHNCAYWNTGHAYLGLGAAAHSFCRLPGMPRKRRFRTIRDVREYVARQARNTSTRAFSRVLSPREALGEEILLALRRTDGFELSPAHEAAFGAVLVQQVAAGLLERDGHTVRLTRRGVELANQVMAEFV